MIYVKANVERITDSVVEAKKLEAAGFKRIDVETVETKTESAAVVEDAAPVQTLSQRRRRRARKASVE